MEKKAVLLFSGGADSTTVLYKLLEEGYKVFPLIIYYGQRNEKETTRAISILEDLSLNYKFLDCSEITSICQSKLLGDSEEVYLGPQTDYTVHSRNLLFISLGAMYAQDIQADALGIGIHDGGFDYDCSKDFCAKMADVLRICDAHKVELYVPYLFMNKEELIRDGLRMKVPYEKTRTCYNDDDTPCGLCPACKSREEIFNKINGENENLSILN